jgi:glycosyltransferase involved in cell wall biosynthesis
MPHRIALVAPWFRSLAHIHARALQQFGHDTLVVTTDAHFESAYGYARELVLPRQLRPPTWVGRWRKLLRAVHDWRPDIVILDETWDVRFLPLARRYPTLLAIHDPDPHDDAHARHGWHLQVETRLRRSARDIACFSQFAAGRVRAERAALHLIPLVSELPEELVRPAGKRRDFVMFGRLSAYKDVPGVLQAWKTYTGTDSYRGDRLFIIGDGELDEPLPEHVTWERGRFAFGDLAQRLSSFKASLAIYRTATQSGVQLTSMQCGVIPLVSDTGALPEYQPAVRPPLQRGDVDGLVRALSELTDATRANDEGTAARGEYERRSGVAAVGEAWSAAIDTIVSSRRGRR